MESVHSNNVELVIKTVNSEGIVIEEGKDIDEKVELETTEYYLDVDGQATEEEDPQFVPVDDDCEESHETQYVAMEVGDSGRIILQDKDVILWNKLCRICANNSDRLIPIFTGEGLEHNLCNKIHSYLPLRVSENDSLPIHVCYNCAATLLAWHEMSKSCLDAQQRLMDLQTKFNLKDQYYNDSTADQENIQAILEVDATNNDETQIQSRCGNTIETVQVVNVSESDRSRRLQTSFIEPIDRQIVSKESVKETNVITNEKVETIEGNCWMTVADFAKSSQKSDESPNCTSISMDPENIAKAIDAETSNVLKKNSKKYKNKNLINEKSPSKSLVCSDCGRLFKVKDSLMRHLRIHRNERPFTCHVCGKQFRDSGGLCRHLRDVHARLKNHTCETCGKSFASKATKDDHQRTHTGERPYICDTCGKGFKSKASLYTHSKTHTNEFPHPCLHCEKKFRRKQELLCHVSMHTGEKNFECDVCFRRFRLKTELRRHTLVHSDDKPFVCDICSFRCRQRRYLNNHVKYKHSFIDKQEETCA